MGVTEWFMDEDGTVSGKKVALAVGLGGGALWGGKKLYDRYQDQVAAEEAMAEGEMVAIKYLNNVSEKQDASIEMLQALLAGLEKVKKAAKKKKAPSDKREKLEKLLASLLQGADDEIELTEDEDEDEVVEVAAKPRRTAIVHVATKAKGKRRT